MIESWMFDSLAVEVSYRAQQMQHAQRVAARKKPRRRADKPVGPRPVAAADSRTEEKVSAG
jgi:hypothetical protein